MFLCREEQLCASLIVSILFFRNLQELLILFWQTGKVKLLKMTQAVVAATNMNRTTIYTALGIPTTTGNDIPKLLM